MTHTESFSDSSYTLVDYLADRDYSQRSRILVPGTNDRGGPVLRRWAAPIVDRFDPSSRTIIDYSSTVGPIVGGLRAPSYDDSKREARVGTRQALSDTLGKVVVLGYSQGADGAWEGIEDAIEYDSRDPADIEAILWGFPGTPGGLKDRLSSRHRVTSALFRYALRANMNGAWTPHPEVLTTVVSMQGDPISAMPPVWPNPIQFARKFSAGFFEIHSGLGKESASSLHKLQLANDPIPVGNSKTTYVELSARDPREQRRERKRQIRS